MGESKVFGHGSLEFAALHVFSRSPVRPCMNTILCITNVWRMSLGWYLRDYSGRTHSTTLFWGTWSEMIPEGNDCVGVGVDRYIFGSGCILLVRPIFFCFCFVEKIFQPRWLTVNIFTSFHIDRLWLYMALCNSLDVNGEFISSWREVKHLNQSGALGSDGTSNGF
jgi:hypothetical protein